MAEPARLAELLGSLSLATDTAAALPRETALRTSIVALRLARASGMQGFELCDVFYAGLLRFLGCTAYAHEMSERFAAGDDLSLLRELTFADSDKPVTVLRAAVRGVSKRASAVQRVAAVGRLASSPDAAAELFGSHCELAVLLARQLGMSEGVIQTLLQTYERWDGKGSPGALRHDAIRPAARVLHVAWRIAAHYAFEGPHACIELIAARRGREFDPALADLVVRERAALLAGFDKPSVWSEFLQAEPAPLLYFEPKRRLEVARVFACFADVKSPFIAGHSLAVAEHAAGAARGMGLRTDAIEELRIAALLHDIGRVAVPNGIWDKPGPLDAMERELAHAHASETERVLARTRLLAPYAALAAQTHERLDGKGYPHRCDARAIALPARLLAAADVYAALRADRPWRPRLSRAQAADTLKTEVQAGMLCADAVAALLEADGQAVETKAASSAGLSDRELEVLRLIARGLGNKQVASELSISPATVKRHLENMFERTALRTRAAITVWALERGLLRQ